MRRNRGSEERQKNIFDFIKEFLMEKGYPPSVREIGKAVGLKSSSTVHGYLARLEEAGLIKRDPTKPRAIEILDENEEYAVVSKETYNGLVRYDRIVKNADKVSEQDILY